MSWRCQGDVGIAAANADYDVVMLPGYRCYLSSGQAARPAAPGKARRGALTMELVYGFEPVSDLIAADKTKHIIGSGGAFWSEGIPNYARLQNLAYPRACATAELTWLDAKQKNWEDFQKRIDTHVKRLKVQGVNYYQPQAQPQPR